MILAVAGDPLYSLAELVKGNEERNRQLGESFREARRETVVIVLAWLAFLIWTGFVCGFGSQLKQGEEVVIAFGMPRWVFLGVVFPWLAACGFTFWFSIFYMKDTDLDPDREREANGEEDGEGQ
jgi:hypothetical protein